MNQIHYFNPGHENAVLNRLPSYTAPASMTTLMRELASLPAWYSSHNDCILVGDDYELEYHEKLQSYGLLLPKLIYSRGLREYNGVEVCMWGVSPQAIRTFEAFNRNYSLSLILPTWNEKYIYLNSRKVATDILKELKSTLSYFDSVSLPQFYSDIESIEQYIYTEKRPLLAKSPYSSSGRGLLWLPSEGLTRVERQILQGMFNKQGEVSVETVYDKKIDFAMEFLSDGEGNISFVGYSLFTTNNKGSYQGNYLYSQPNIVEKITQYLDYSILCNTKAILSNILSIYYGSIYKGCIGVDMMVVMENNNYVLHPCVEINMRYNMGYLSIKLFENFIDPASFGKYLLDFDAKGDLKKKHDEMEDRFPLVIANGRVKSGYLSLCPISDDTKYRAYILIESLEESSSKFSTCYCCSNSYIE